MRVWDWDGSQGSLIGRKPAEQALAMAWEARGAELATGTYRYVRREGEGADEYDSHSLDTAP